VRRELNGLGLASFVKTSAGKVLRAAVFTIDNALSRMKLMAVDPWDKMFDIRQSIP
jgi:DNA primase